MVDDNDDEVRADDMARLTQLLQDRGIEAPEEFLALQQRYVDGEADLDEVGEALDALCDEEEHAESTTGSS
jgi:hypothetical protein